MWKDRFSGITIQSFQNILLKIRWYCEFYGFLNYGVILKPRVGCGTLFSSSIFFFSNNFSKISNYTIVELGYVVWFVLYFACLIGKFDCGIFPSRICFMKSITKVEQRNANKSFAGWKFRATLQISAFTGKTDDDFLKKLLQIIIIQNHLKERWNM